MRKTLTAAAALAPLWFVANAGQALATTTISTGRTTPISTSTANNGAADDIDIASGGSITLTSPSAAVTLDSNNKVTNEGTITFTDTDNAVGVLISGGRTGSFTNSGSIIIKESTSPSDTNSDGVKEAPYATGGGVGKERYGVRVQGASPFVGDIVNDTSGIIQVTGKNSYGLSVEAPLTGNLKNLGSITVTGDNTVGLRETGGVSGNVQLSGAVSATGQGAQAVVLNGNIGGRLSIYSAETSTGYGQTTRSPYNSVQTLIQSTASETQQGGSALTIAGNVAGGVYIGAPPAGQPSTSTTDLDGDGINDGGEGTGVVSTFGQAPAIVIGAAGRDVSLGAIQFTTTPANPYGLVIAGTVVGAGVYDGVTANAIRIGDSSGTGTVHIAGGMKIGGTVSATAYGADSNALHILTGSTVPEVNVVGSLTAITLAPLPNTTTGVATPFNGSSTALRIDAGATVNTLTVSGTISALTDGDGNGLGAGKTNNATAVVDGSGTLSTVNITGHITATINPSLTTVTATGSKTALDLHNNTTGVTINMTQAPQVIATAVTASGTTTTTYKTGPVVQNTTGAAVVTSTTSSDGTTVTTTTTPIAPTIVGDVFLGNGPNTVNLLAGSITGGLSLGTNTASLTIDNGASYSGALAYGGTGLALNIVNGSLTTTNPATLTATSLNVGANGVLNFAIDPANNRATNFIVNGAANLTSGAKLGVNLISTLTGPQTFTLIKANSLTVGAADSTLASEVPYLFYASVQSNQAAGTLNLTIRQKTASEMSLNPAESAALSAIYTAIATDTPIQTALFAQYQRPGFIGLYDQLLPDYAGGAFRAASAASRTISRLTAEPNEIENPTGSRGAWAQQFFVGSELGRGETAGFRASGFGYVGGVETGGLGFGAVGATAAFVATNISDPHSPGDNRIGMSELEGGLYWQGETGGLILDARVGAGVHFFSAKRQFIETDTTGLTTLSRQTKASWTGYSLTGHFGAAYQVDLNSVFFLRPQAHLDYFLLNEGGYSERNGGPAMNLAYDSRTGNEASGTASVVAGMKLGRGLIWRPELELGVRDVFAGDAGSTTARFISGGSSFTLSPADISGPSGLIRFKLKASSEYYEVGFEAGGEAKSRYAEGDAKLTVRVLF